MNCSKLATKDDRSSSGDVCQSSTQRLLLAAICPQLFQDQRNVFRSNTQRAILVTFDPDTVDMC